MSDCSAGLKARGICVIIPTYNNAGTIVDVVSRTQRFCDDVIVVSDGCTDGTVELLRRMERVPDVLELKKNYGKGRALKEGFKHALRQGFAYAITLDADGQHFPEDIPLLLDANRRHPDAIIVGCREGLENAKRSKSSSFANKFSNFWFFVQTFRRLRDTQTGYRLYSLKRLHGLPFLTSRYEAELELLVFAAWHGVKLVEQDVRVYYPPMEERVSHFRPVYDFARISALNVVLCLLALVFALPLFILRNLWAILKSLVIYVFYLLATLLVLTPAVFLYLKIGGTTDAKKEKLHVLICKSARFAMRALRLFGLKYTQVNREGETFEKPSVIICNHQSHLDLLPMLALTPKLVILTADWVWNNPLYGFIIHNADYLPASQGIDRIAPDLKRLVENGYSIVVYPEGTRSMDCSVGRFHQGAFFLADYCRADILPLVLYGAGRALPKHGRLLRRWPMQLEIDPRIPNAEIAETGATFKEQASHMRRYYIKRCEEVADALDQTVR